MNLPALCPYVVSSSPVNHEGASMIEKAKYWGLSVLPPAWWVWSCLILKRQNKTNKKGSCTRMRKERKEVMMWSVPAIIWKDLGHDCSRSLLKFLGTVSLELMIFTLPSDTWEIIINSVSSGRALLVLTGRVWYLSCPSLWRWTLLRCPCSAGSWWRCTAAQRWRHLPPSLLSEGCPWKSSWSESCVTMQPEHGEVCVWRHAGKEGKQLGCCCKPQSCFWSGSSRS